MSPVWKSRAIITTHSKLPVLDGEIEPAAALPEALERVEADLAA